jgi:hypothetical protein
MTCPECGSDLREVGIIAPNMRLPQPRIVRAIIWTLLLPGGAFLISWLLMATILPFSVKHKADRQIICQSPYLNVTIDAYAEEYPWQPAFVSHIAFHADTVRLDNTPFTAFLEAHFSSGDYHYWSRTTSYVGQSTGFNGAAIAAWLTSAKVNVGDPHARALCDEIYNAVAELHHGTAAKSTPLLDANGLPVGLAKPATFWSVRDEPNPVMIAALALLWLIIWIEGLRRIYRRTRHNTAQQI